MRAPTPFFLVMAVMACGGTSEPASTAQPLPPAAPASDPHAGMAPKAAAPSAPEATPTGPASAGGLTWEHAAPLVRRAPKSSMRVAEYGVEGDALAELTVFYFGPDQGGSVDANVTRWLGQIKQPDGSDSATKAKRTTRDVNGVSVTQIEVSGDFAGGMAMPGAPAPTPIKDATLLGAIAVGPSGPVFFKLVAPGASVEKVRAGFDQLIASLHK